MRNSIDVKLVEFKTSDGLTLSGLLSAPKRPTVGVIHVHGIFSSFYRSRLAKSFANDFTKKGVAFLNIETRGSSTMMGFAKGSGSRLRYVNLGGGVEKFEDCVKDIDAAVRFMKRQGVRRVYLEGISTGAQKITYYAWKHPGKVRGIILLGAVDDYNLRRKELGRKFGSAVALARAISKKDPAGLLPSSYIGVHLTARRFLSFADPKNPEARLFNYDRPRLSELASLRIPVLSIFGSREQHATRPVREMNEIIARNCSSRLSRQLLIKGANHSFHGKAEEAGLSILGWITYVEGEKR